ncbi:hypothetical protein NHL51_04285 [Leucobacter sp. gxy201]|uniref:hypothetical protein n=1 Tax=Leucobacter sp. gxy201 TaxID=2957200 RepID=UPI003DA1BDDB
MVPSPIHPPRELPGTADTTPTPAAPDALEALFALASTLERAARREGIEHAAYLAGIEAGRDKLTDARCEARRARYALDAALSTLARGGAR